MNPEGMIRSTITSKEKPETYKSIVEIVDGLKPILHKLDFTGALTLDFISYKTNKAKSVLLFVDKVQRRGLYKTIVDIVDVRSDKELKETETEYPHLKLMTAEKQ